MRFAMNAPQSRLCPVCGSDHKRLLFQQRFAGLSRGSLLEGYDVVACQDCGFGFADHIPEQAAFDAYYRDMSKYEYQHRGGQEPEWVLDRFCATGRLLALLKEQGFPHVLGLDPSPVCAEASRRLYGVPVLTRPLADLRP